MPNDLEKRLLYIETNTAEIRDWIDREIEILKERLELDANSIKELQLVIFGKDLLHIKGVTERLEKLEDMISAVHKDFESLPKRVQDVESAVIKVNQQRQSERDQLQGALKAFRLAAAVAGLGGGASLFALLSRILE